ncbi:F-box/kelch-repeat protein At3g23880-like [Salvia miltiorrhiza]|uniref:F-box/kelch-repeat protein At3g23880-like n=1 Tax=Salvia miltiorrhiza TaxID=226208 RepID=UPI0025AB6F21|nr:F-box/kelch-repeat protein At3g23880-like [Salvia miltiorrhiza]
MDSKRSKLSLLFLPQEIIEEILSRLAVKSLLRFRCVSKSWRSLIGSERFIKTHLQNSSKNAALAHHRKILSYDSPKFVNWWEFPDMVGCCNGLVCFLQKRSFFLWNPATGISNKLSEIVMENGDRTSSVYKYGFGWDESSGAYKVFAVFASRLDESMCKVYSSKTNSWKIVEDWEDDNVCGAGQFASGKLHWHYYEGTGGMNIVTFDLKSEKFGKMEVPCPCDSRVWLGVLEGRLCVFSYNKRTHFDAWVMKEDSWVKVMAVLVYEPYQSYLLFPTVFKCLEVKIGLIRGSVKWVQNLNLVKEDVLSLFDIITSSLAANIYVESLVSPVFRKKV